MTDHTKLETTAMDRIEVAKAIYHATPRNKPFDKLSAFKRERLIAEAGAFLASLSAAGYRILGPDDVDPVTVEKCAEVAERLAEGRKEKEQKIGGWPWTATPFANHFWCEEIAAAIRSLGEGR